MQSNSEIKVSVCVITYNHEKYISECLDSILSQKTNFNFNVFVSDDCSSDNTLEILQNYAAIHKNVHVLSRCGLPKSVTNGKPTGNMNLIENVSRATGEYVALCDGDDVWTSNLKLQKQVDVLEGNQEVSIVCSSKNKLIDGRLIKAKSFMPDLLLSYRWLYFFNPIPSSSAIFRVKNFVKPGPWYYFDIDVGDWPLWFIVSNRQKIYKFSEPFMNYRIHSSGTWGEKRKSQKAHSAFKVVRTLRKEYGGLLFEASAILHFLRLSFFRVVESFFACFKKS